MAQFAAANPMVANLAGLSSITGKSSLATEVKILQSPSVLKPVYDFVKSKKLASGEDVRGWIYKNWVKSNLSIKLEEGTSVLNLTYRDTDESLLLPVLKLIGNTYQEYSNRDNAKSIDNALKFTYKQSIALKTQAMESNRRLDAFKFTYGIKDDSNEINSPLLKRLATPLPQTSRDTGPLAELAAINKELTRRLQFFTESDPSIVRLQKREAILKYINQTGGGLISISAGGTKELNREILLKFKELQRTAARDNEALAAIETELLSLQIQKAQERLPWELISTPTALDKPVAPRKLRLIALGMLGGLLLGSSASLLVDHRTGLVHSEEELKSLLPCRLLKHLPSTAQETWSDAADLLATGLLKEVSGNESVALIPLGKMPQDQLQAFGKELQRALKDRELLISTDLRETSSCATQLLVTSPGAASRTQLSHFCQKLALQGAPIAGWLLIDPDFDLG